MVSKKKNHKKTKIYPNDPCWCGSSLKLKKCHGIKTARVRYPFGEGVTPIIEVPAKFIPEELKEKINAPKEPFDKSGYLTGRPFIDTTFKGKRVRAEGSKVLLRPLNETIHEFFLNRFSEWLGRDWLQQEYKNAALEKHIIAKWYEEVNETIMSRSVKENSCISSIKKTGNIRALLAMAYDFYSLAHCSAKVRKRMINRLKQPAEFQGVRYEIAMGGIAVRSGFEIEWESHKGEGGRVEFIGRHKQTGDRVAFEAKSHRRKGVLGFGDSPFDIAQAGVKVMDHVREAIQQAPMNIPLVIFDDLNLPLARHGEETQWFSEVQDHLKKHHFFEENKDTTLSALYLTNFGWHFHESLDDMPANEVASFFKKFPPYNLWHETHQLLERAAREYGFVPAKEEEFGQLR